MSEKINYLLLSFFLPFFLFIETVCASPVILKIAIPATMPPFVISDNQSGIIIDIINHIYQNTEGHIKYSYLSNNRMEKEFFYKKHAAAFSIPFKQHQQPIYYSKPLLSFKNTAITLGKRNITIDSIAHLMPLRITAFQNASNILGERFKKMAKSNPHYDEVTNQEHQIRLLLKGRTDVILMEERIFWYYFKKLQLKPSSLLEFRFHPIFNESERYFVFHSKQMRDTFDQKLNKLRESSNYQIIFDQYITHSLKAQ